MAQLKEDEWPADREPTTTEKEVALDPESRRRPGQPAPQREEDAPPRDHGSSNVTPDQTPD